MKRIVEVKPNDYVNQLETIAHDKNIGRLSEMTEVSDIGPSLNTLVEIEEAQAWFNQQNHTPAIWHHYLKTGKHPPFNFEKTSFVNLFSKDIIILFDIYRPPWKPYFTSDVFFYQWLKSLGREIDLRILPAQFPTTFYIHNVTNHNSKHITKEILDSKETDTCVIDDLSDENWKRLKSTPHLKTIQRILNTFNEINGLRREFIYKIVRLQLYRNKEMYHFKLTFRQA